jgi:hypothetical protein
MSIPTSQQIGKWYDLYKTIDVTFTKEIIKTTGLETRGVCLKCIGEQWPCVLYSSSFSGAKVIASSKQALSERVSKANGLASIRFSFRLPDKPDPVSFFISGKVLGYSNYAQSGGDLQYVSIQYTQRPPDDFIDIIGRLLEANMNSTRRRDERILLSPDAMRRLNLLSKDSFVFVQGVPRKCILRDLSFTGAKAIIVGLAKFLVGKECLLRVELDEPRESLDIKGAIVRYEDVEGRKDLTAIAVHFDEASVPMSFKMHINDYLSQVRSPHADSEASAHAGAQAEAPKASGSTPAK